MNIFEHFGEDISRGEYALMQLEAYEARKNYRYESTSDQG